MAMGGSFDGENRIMLKWVACPDFKSHDVVIGKT